MNEHSFTYKCKKKSGSSYHHLCYEVASREEMMGIVGSQKLIMVKGPIPAILFDNREVWFYYSRNKQVVEFVI